MDAGGEIGTLLSTTSAEFYDPRTSWRPSWRNLGRSARRATGLSKPGRLLRNLKARPRLWLRYGLRTHAELLAALRLE